MEINFKYNREWAICQKEPEFIFFWGHKGKKDQISKSCLSQWWPCNFKANNIEYNCAEQYMMSEKAKLFHDEDIYNLILKEKFQWNIKSYGRKIKNFNDEIWNKNKFNIVVQGNILKFSQNEELKKFLVETGNKILVEASPYDKIWGIGMGIDEPDVKDPNKWKGENLLGFALMEVRDIINK